MDNKTKGILAVLGLGGLAWFFSRAGAAPPEGIGASISLQVLDPEGNVVPANSPVTLQLGVTYTIRATVTNTSTQGSVPAGVSLRTWCACWVIDGYVGYLERTEAFGPGEARVFQFAYTPGGYGEYPGLTGSFIEAWVTPWDSGTQLARVQDSINYAPSPIAYGATVTVGAV